MQQDEDEEAGAGRLYESKSVEKMSLPELIELQRKYPARFVQVLDKSLNVKVPIGLLHLPVLDTGA
ncbi:hypothetical protein KAK07_23705 [Ideonella sp. 4Y16]|uniref:Uncharacterized protein n=1 Tax=Ideonella alba TaxID=2824118 RepID=A0A940YAF8_9BURK|nr:hypothetical protein [Ideonella alba]MBQ0930623.1 hypothetical protein [Ideonella alba]MBQ0946364.1 hypothetical protein [Ideonella alba]